MITFVGGPIDGHDEEGPIPYATVQATYLNGEYRTAMIPNLDASVNDLAKLIESDLRVSFHG